MRALIRNNISVLVLYLLLLCTAAWFIGNYEKNAIHLYINQFVGNYFLNLFFYYVTYLGDGRFAAFLLIIIMLYNVRAGFYATVSFLVSALISNGLKYFFFDDVNRPFFIFNYIDKFELNLVEGVDVHIHNSFPSGHATQAFAILMSLIFTTKSQPLKLVIFSLAVITSFSRVYLSQHWLVDITAGSLVGFFTSLFFWFIFIKQNRFPALDKPMADLRKP